MSGEDDMPIDDVEEQLVRLTDVEILRTYPEKFHFRKWMDIALDYQVALRLIEMGWNVKCITPGTPIDTAMGYSRTLNVSDEYILYVAVAIAPTRSLQRDNYIPQLVQDAIAFDVPLELIISRFVPQSEEDEGIPFLMNVADSAHSVENAMREHAIKRKARS